jgi:CheY-like chemotaxis protein
MIVLVADDDPVARMILSRQLENLGAQVVTANDGRAALDAATGQSFDVLFIDRSMPELNGLEVARSVRAGHTPATSRSVALVAVSGDGEEQLPVYLAAGFDDLITKPANATRLAEVLARWAPVSALRQ